MSPSNNETTSPLEVTMDDHVAELKAATIQWVEKKGGSASMGEADKNFLRTVKLMVHGMEQSMKNEEAKKSPQPPPQHDKDIKHKDIGRMIEDRLEKFRYQLDNDIFYNFRDELREYAENSVYDAFYNRDIEQNLLRSFEEHMAGREDALLSEQMREVRDHVLAEIKAQKEAPESAQDMQTEWGMPID